MSQVKISEGIEITFNQAVVKSYLSIFSIRGSLNEKGADDSNVFNRFNDKALGHGE